MRWHNPDYSGVYGDCVVSVPSCTGLYIPHKYMRNKFKGICYRCKKIVEKFDGHFERNFGHWRVQHASCAIENRKKEEDK